MYQTDQYEGMIAETVSMKGTTGIRSTRTLPDRSAPARSRHGAHPPRAGLG